MAFFNKIRDSLATTRSAVSERVNGVLSAFTRVDEDLLDELLETLIMADMGVTTCEDIIDRLRAAIKDKRITEGGQVKAELKQIISDILHTADEGVSLTGKPAVIMVIGVNGAGKTTSVGKLANLYRSRGKKVLVAAADTFRAAAIEQLETWCNRANVDIIKSHEGADPSAVVFDACAAAKARGIDVLICDTAGRLHNKKNLMEELKKMNRILERELPESSREILLVLDATTGQNAVSQAKEFRAAADITGIILTKLDGTAKGGIVLAIKNEYGIPVKLVGTGEKIDDMSEFDAEEFAEGIID